MDGRGQMRPPRPYNKWRVKSRPYGMGRRSAAHFHWVAVLPGVVAPRGDGERLGAPGLTEVMAALGE